MKKGLFKELLNLETDTEEIDNQADDIESANIPLQGSPVYPRIFWGESTKPLNGQFPESEYVDDNIHRSYQGLLSYFG